jgi:hypothetical protein
MHVEGRGLTVDDHVDAAKTLEKCDKPQIKNRGLRLPANGVFAARV